MIAEAQMRGFELMVKEVVSDKVLEKKVLNKAPAESMMKSHALHGNSVGSLIPFRCCVLHILTGCKATGSIILPQAVV
jgi:hypothetical protein